VTSRLLRTAFFLAWAGLPLCPAAGDGPADLPRLRYVVVAPERLPALLEKADKGVLVQMDRQEFEKKVKEAARGGAPTYPPRLVKARYWAKLDAGGSALVGAGDWTVINPGPGPGALPLADLRLPLQNARRLPQPDDPRDKGGEAVLGNLDGKAQGLWVEKAGQQTFTFDWSLRGSADVGETHFDVQVPRCAAASLELTVPADYLVTVPHKTVLLSGPDFAGEADKRVWRLGFAGRSQVGVVLRRTAGPGAVPALVLANTNTSQQILPDRLLAEFRVEAEVLRQPVQELVFDCDPGLRPTEVTGPSLPLKGWEVLPPPARKKGGKAKEDHAVLVVRLREPLRGPLPPLRVAAEAPLAPGRPWVSPGLRLRGAAGRGETLELRIHPDAELEDWTGGGFRLVKTGTDEEGAQVLTLIDGGSAGAGRPGGRLRVAGPEVAVRQTAWWDVGPGGSSVRADLTFEVVRGRLFQLGVRLPPGGKAGWRVEGVDLAAPRDLLRGWVTTTDRGLPALVVDLLRSLPAGKQARLIVRLRGPGPGAVPPGGLALAFPEVGALNPGPFSGALGVSVDPLYHVAAARPSAPAADAGPAGPWGKAPLQLYYEYRDVPLAGQLRLLPHRPVLHARCRNEVLLAADRARLKAQLTLDPVVGAPEAVVLYLSAPGGRWLPPADGGPGAAGRLERLPVREALPALLALPPAGGLGAAAAVAARPPGSYWRLLLSQPLTRPRTVALERVVERDGRPGPAERQWEVPVLTVPGADRLEGEVVVQLVGAELLDVQVEGLRESGRDAPAAGKPAPRAGRPGLGQDVWRTFRYGSPLARQPRRLRFRIRPLPAAVSAREVCDESRLTTRVEQEGRLVHAFSFRVRGWRSRTMPVRLPPGARLVAARAEGRWIDRLARRPRDDGEEVELPVTAGADVHHFEVLYAAEGGPSGWRPWAEVESQVPRLPVRPLSFRRTWQLPPGLVPLSSDVRRLPDPGAPPDAEAWDGPLRRSWQAGQGLLAAAGPPFSGDDWVTAQRHRVEDAEAALRKEAGPGQDRHLGALLERLALDHLQAAVPVVIDARALRAAGLGPDTDCPAGGEGPFWNQLGLAYVPCRGAALFTTRVEWQRWQALTGQSRLEDNAVDEAVRKAARHGQDGSGRFLGVTHWARGPGGPDAAGDEAAAAPDRPPGAGWTEWEPLAGARAEEALVVVRRSGIHALGLALAGVLLLLAWRFRPALSGCWRVRLLLGWLALGGLSVLWLPGPLRAAAVWPALAGLVVACAWYLRWHGGPRPAGGEKKATAAGTAAAAGTGLILLAVILRPTARAGGPDGDTVLILPGPPGDPGRQSVLVTPDLLKKLDTLLARRSRGGPDGAVLLSARYEGAVKETEADIKGEFEVYCAADRAVVKVPLGGVTLKEGALMDGAFVYPVSLAAPDVGYAVTVMGRKGQTVHLTLPFGVRLTAAGDGHDLTFTVPRLAQAHLDLALPAGARRPQAVTALGQQQVVTEGGQARLRASLGLADLGRPERDSAVHVHWRQPGAARRPAVVQVGEFYFWDLRPPAPDLTAVLKYAVTSGTVAGLGIDLPPGVEVRSVEVSPQQLPPRPGVQAHLKGWAVAPGQGRRRLTLTLAEPVTGRLQVTLGLVPRLPTGPGSFTLRLPAPAAPPVQKEKSPTGLLAYRVEGLEAADRPQHLGVINIPFGQFVKEWQDLGLRTFPAREAGRAAGRAYSFRRTAADAALELTLAAPQPSATATVDWRVAPGHADLRASARLSAGGAGLAAAAPGLTLVEWDVPPAVTVSGVTGPDVQRWSRSGPRLQVWLRGWRKQTALELHGWAHPVPGGPGQFRPPCVRLLTPRPAQTTVRVAAAPGVALQESALDNLRPLPAPSPLTYEAEDPGRPYGGAFRVLAAEVRAEARVLTAVEARDGVASFTAHVQLGRPPGELRPLRLRLRNWPGGEVSVEPTGLQAGARKRGRAEWTWDLRPAAGGSPRYAIKVAGKARLAAGARVPVPDVTVSGAVVKERWLAVLGGDLRVEQERGLRPVPKAAADLHRWPAEAELIRREGAVWKVEAADWQLALVPRPAAVSAAVTVLLAEQAAAVADGRHWLHEAVFTLAAEGGADLHVSLPEGARLLAAELDGGPVAPRQTGPQSLWLPLPGSAGVHVLRVRWQAESGAEPLDSPRLQRLRLQEGQDYPVLWTVCVPPGYLLARRPGAGAPAPVSAARLELERAAAQLRLAELLAERRRDRAGLAAGAPLPAVLQRFAWYCRRAEGALLADPGASAERGPDGRGLADWLRGLRRREEALARKHGLARARAVGPPPAEDATLAPLGERGTPAFWRTGPGDGPPAFALQALTARQAQERLVATELLLGLLLGVWILSHLTRLAGWLRRLWPEQLFLLALLGWQEFGPSLVGALLVAVALGGRLLALGRWLQALFRRHAEGALAPGSSVTST
jgi:hypothetical protein